MLEANLQSPISAGMMNVSWAKASCHCKVQRWLNNHGVWGIVFGYHTEMITYLKEFYFKTQTENYQPRNDEDFPSWCEGKGAKVLRSKLSFLVFLAQKQHTQEKVPFIGKKDSNHSRKSGNLIEKFHLDKQKKRWKTVCVFVQNVTWNVLEKLKPCLFLVSELTQVSSRPSRFAPSFNQVLRRRCQRFRRWMRQLVRPVGPP